MCNQRGNPFFEYKSTRFIRVRDIKIVSVYYITILLVLAYIALFTIWWKKGYQSFDEVTGTTSLKVKGTGSSAITSDYFSFENMTVWDAMDLVTPATEEDALFLTTAFINTPNQTRAICDGNSDTGKCSSNSDCSKGSYNSNSQGITTGTCGNNSYCQVYSWCPLEIDEDPIIVENVGEFTIFVKIDIEFSQFGVTRSNTDDKAGTGKPVNGYNLFTVNDILSNATNGKITNYKQVADVGAIILVTSEWNCNLDLGEDECSPDFKFTRLDNFTNSISTGFNYRSVQYDTTGNSRLLKKLYGVRIIFAANGKAGKFSFSALTITFGAGLAYLGIASFIADVVLEKFLPESDKYDRVKYQYIDSGEKLIGNGEQFGEMPESYQNLK